MGRPSRPPPYRRAGRDPGASVTAPHLDAFATNLARAVRLPTRQPRPDAWSGRTDPQGGNMVGILIGILLAALVFWLCTARGLPVIVGIIAAVIVLLAAAPLSGVGRGRV